LVELMLVVVIIGILVMIAIPRISTSVQAAKLNTDKANVRILNGATAAYRTQNSSEYVSVFMTAADDEAKIQTLVDSEYILEMIETKSEDALFAWNSEQQLWYLLIDEEPVMLTQFGNTFMDIAEGFIKVIVDNYEANGRYGRTWGDYRFTDLGLEPDEWDEAYSHYQFRPSGSDLLVTPEEGFTPSVETISGEVKTVYANYNIIYDAETGKWYYHSVKPENEIDINTLQLNP